MNQAARYITMTARVTTLSLVATFNPKTIFPASPDLKHVMGLSKKIKLSEHNKIRLQNIKGKLCAMT